MPIWSLCLHSSLISNCSKGLENIVISICYFKSMTRPVDVEIFILLSHFSFSFEHKEKNKFNCENVLFTWDVSMSDIANRNFWICILNQEPILHSVPKIVALITVLPMRARAYVGRNSWHMLYQNRAQSYKSSGRWFRRLILLSWLR